MSAAAAPPKLDSLSHVSLPCRDLDEGKRFYTRVLGGKIRVDVPPTFAIVDIAGVDIGIGTEGCNWLSAGSEYPHVAFFAGPEAMLQMKDWLTRCGIPSSNYWTRNGSEALMFFRDPSGNLLELFCKAGFKGAQDLPKGPPRGHGTAVDINTLFYDNWSLPAGH